MSAQQYHRNSEGVSVSDIKENGNQSFSISLRHNQDKDEKTLNINLLEEGIIKFRLENESNVSKFNVDKVLPTNVSPLDSTKSKVRVENNPEKSQIFITSADLLRKSKHNEITLAIDRQNFNINLSNNGKNLATLNSLQLLQSGPHPTADFSLETNYLYGIPERADHFLLGDSTSGNPYRIFNCDRFGYQIFSKSSCYGTVPILVAHLPTGETFALFWRKNIFKYISYKEEKQIYKFMGKIVYGLNITLGDR